MLVLHEPVKLLTDVQRVGQPLEEVALQLAGGPLGDEAAGLGRAHAIVLQKAIDLLGILGKLSELLLLGQNVEHLVEGHVGRGQRRHGGNEHGHVAVHVGLPLAGVHGGQKEDDDDREDGKDVHYVDGGGPHDVRQQHGHHHGDDQAEHHH